MKKVLFALIALIIIAIAASMYYVYSNLDAILKAAIEMYGSEATHTAVRVEKVKVKLTDGSQAGSGAIYGLTIGNPFGYSTPHAFTLGEVSIKIDLNSLRSPPYVIDNITVRAPQVFFEVNKDKKNNLNELKEKLTAGLPKDTAAKDTGSTAPVEPRLIIRKITFSEGAIKAKVTPLNKNYDLALPAINMANLGGKKGATPTEIANEIIDRLIAQAKAEVKKKGIDAELDKIKGKAREKVDAEKARLKEKVEAKKEQEKQKLDDKLKGLLKK